MRLFTALIAVVALAAPVSAASAAQIRISYSAVYDQIRPDPRPGLRLGASFDVSVSENGAISEQINRGMNGRSDKFNNGMKLGSGWRVLGANQLKRTIDQPQSVLTLVITTSGSSCSVDVKWTLKPGFSEFKFKRISDGGWGFYTQPQLQSQTCTIT